MYLSFWLVLICILYNKTVIKKKKKVQGWGEFPGVQWLGLRALTAEGPGSVCGLGTKIPQVVWPKKKNRNGENSLLAVVAAATIGSQRQ